MADGTPERFCPICQARTQASLCPRDGVQTLPASVFEDPTAQLTRGTLVADRFQLLELLGRGAMGAVYAASQVSMDRRVALKVLNRTIAQDPSAVRRFYREAKNASRLEHPHVVRVHDFGVDEDKEMPFIAMELVEGRTLRSIISLESPIPLARIGALLEQVARALVAAHQAGIVHRDLKPDNIMVTRLADGDEHVTVLDFGIAKTIRGPEGSLTGSGFVVGTPRYMSPEQVRGETVDGRSDLYALGCIFHEMIEGAPPFTGGEAMSLMLQHVNAFRPSLTRSFDGEPSGSAARTLHRALLAREPELRPSTARAVARIFRAIARSDGGIDVPAILAAAHTEEAVSARWSSDAESSDEMAPADSSTLVKPAPGDVPTPVESRKLSALDSPVTAGDDDPGRRILVPLFLGVAAAGIIGLVAASQFVIEPSRGPTRNEPASLASPPLPDEPSASAEDAPEGPAARVVIRVDGSPAHAVITGGDGATLCSALPCELELPRDETPVAFEVSADGHRGERLRLVPDRDRQAWVELDPS